MSKALLLAFLLAVAYVLQGCDVGGSGGGFLHKGESTHGANLTAPPTKEPTVPPTPLPTTTAPTETPTKAPTEAPTDTPTESPTEAPTDTPTEASTEAPTDTTTEAPTDSTEPEPELLYYRMVQYDSSDCSGSPVEDNTFSAVAFLAERACQRMPFASAECDGEGSMSGCTSSVAHDSLDLTCLTAAQLEGLHNPHPCYTCGGPAPANQAELDSQFADGGCASSCAASVKIVMESMLFGC